MITYAKKMWDLLKSKPLYALAALLVLGVFVIPFLFWGVNKLLGLLKGVLPASVAAKVPNVAPLAPENIIPGAAPAPATPTPPTEQA